MSERIGIVHLGLGAFHRAHQAVYLERYRQRSGDNSWCVCSANLRSNVQLVEQMQHADHHYHVAEYADSDHVTLCDVGIIRETLFTGCDESGRWGRDLERLLARLCSDDVRIVTLTVTEKGYFLNPASGQLMHDESAIAADVAKPHAPGTAPGLLVEALARRRALGKPPFTVLSCDNMPHNGLRTRAAVSALAACRDTELAAWIDQEVAFPNSMVDRIVPAMDGAAASKLAELGVNEPCAVVCEQFAQWVIEDQFPQGRPDWEDDGVEMVTDVTPFETMKLRMLNGSHSMLAYLGMLDGVETVFDAVTRDDFAALLSRYMLDEAAPTLSMPRDHDLAAYATQLMSRFANDSLEHRLQQIAMDGSQKLPQRWLEGANARLKQGGDISCTALGVAAWIYYTSGRNMQGENHPVDDPMATQWAELHSAYGQTPQKLVDAFLAVDSVFPPALVNQHAFSETTAVAYRHLTTHGVADTVANLDNLLA